MDAIKDDRGYNQKFAPTKALEVRTERRCAFILKEMANLDSTSNILEIGSGTGEISFMMAQKTSAQVMGTDLCVPFIEEANRNFKLPNLSFEVLDFNKPDSLNGKQFDYVVGNGILHHLYYNLDKALKSILALLKKNGKIIFLEPNLKNPYCYVIFSYPYFRKRAHLEPDEMAFTHGFIKKKLTSAGYTEIKVEYKDFLLPNTPDFLINPLIAISNISESIPGINQLAQSLFIIGQKK